MIETTDLAETSSGKDKRGLGRWLSADCLALVVVAGLAGLAYGWALERDPLEPYYAAGVRSMAMSWHNFFYGAFDPAATISLDKLPGAFWVQAVSVRIFGFHTWAIVLPQVVEGILTVLILHRAVRRLAGPTAALVAAVVAAVSPATVALDRGNISDTLMILLVVLAADAVSAALSTGSQRRLLLAGLWVGLAFQAKMIEAWMVLPALALVYLVGGPGQLPHRVRQVLAAGLVAAVVSLSWMTVVTLLPSSHRPYVDGSQHNSTYEQVFVYNGFGRFGDQTPLQLLAGQSLSVGLSSHSPARGPGRLLHGDLGRDTGWLVPADLAIGLAGLASRRRRPRTDPLRCCFILWGSWLLTLAVVFSAITSINAYYTAVLTPAVAALVGTGLALAWEARHSGVLVRAAMAVVVAGTVAYAAWLVPSEGTGVPGWLAPLVIAVGLVAVAWAVGSNWRTGERFFAGALAAGLLAVALAPAAGSVELIAHHEGAFDTPFEPAAERNAIVTLFVRTPAQVATTISKLESVQRGAPYLLATQTSALASVFIVASGREVLPIGGFTGTIPSPTLSQLRADVAQGRFHLVLVATTDDPRLQWVAAHCLDVGRATATLTNYYCLRPDAAR